MDNIHWISISVSTLRKMIKSEILKSDAPESEFELIGWPECFTLINNRWLYFSYRNIWKRLFNQNLAILWRSKKMTWFWSKMGFTCCQVFFENKTSFEDHQRRFHFPTSKFKNNNFECPLCGSSVKMLLNYRRHLIKDHSNAVYDIFGQQQADTEQQPIQS